MADNGNAQFLGLAAASLAGSFTTNRTVISVLYDAMKVEWNNGATDPEHMPSASLAIVASPAARGQKVKFDLRGFSYPPGAGAVRLDIAGTESRAASAEENFFASVTATLNADDDVTRVIVTLDLAKPEDGSAASFTLDSIDMSLPDCAGGREG